MLYLAISSLSITFFFYISFFVVVAGVVDCIFLLLLSGILLFGCVSTVCRIVIP